MPPWAVLYAASALATAAVLVGVGLPLLGAALVVVEGVVLGLVLLARRER